MSTSETQSAPIKELHRSQDDRILAGVAEGLGRYFDISPTFFRIGFAILTLVGGAGILLYVAAWLVIPDEGESDSIVSHALRRHRDRPWLLAGVGLVAIRSSRCSRRRTSCPTAVSRGHCCCLADW